MMKQENMKIMEIFEKEENMKSTRLKPTTTPATKLQSFTSLLIVILVIIFNFNLVMARKLPITTDTDLTEIILGDKTILRETLPIYSKVYLKCNLKNFIWFKNGEKLNMEIRRKEILKFEKITKSDSGIYSCRSGETNKWSNLTLNILSGGTEIKKNHNDNFSDSIQSYSQISETLDEIKLNGNVDNQPDEQNDNSEYDENYVYPNLDEIDNPETDNSNNFNQNDHLNDNRKNPDAKNSSIVMSTKKEQSQHQPQPQQQQNVNINNNNNNKKDEIEEIGSPPTWKSKDSLLKTIPKPSGSFIKLSCAVNGYPIPNITWTKDDKPIERIMGKINYKKWIMSMEEAIPEDSGLYKCTVCNIYQCISHTTKLLIQDRMRFRPILRDGYPGNLTVLENSTAKFECKMYSDLAVYIVWIGYFSNDTIENVDNLTTNYLYKSEKERANMTNFKIFKTDSDKSEVLKIENVKHEDEGWYTCIAANSLGQSHSSAYLHVVDEFETPVSMPVKNFPLYMTIFKIGIGVLFLFGTVVILTIVRKIKQDKLMKHRMETIHQWTKKVIIYKPSCDPSSPETIVMPIIKIEKQRTTLLKSSNCDPSPFNEYEFPLDSNWEIPRNQLTKGKILGEGAFGRVVKAEAIGLPKHPGRLIVAVKMVKEGHTDADIASLVREMEVMKMIGKHINIIDFLGCCSQEGPLYVIVEYAKHGNLKQFLERNGPNPKYDPNLYEDMEKQNLTQKDLLSFSFQVARGMEYLASKRCIHRDLAARNALVSDDYIIKIADFGLARDIQDTDYYRKSTNGQLPIKWMAPESLKDKFYDTQSDVWSYGVLLWEIMTFGSKPYENIISVEELYNYLMSGHRMEKPSTCSLNIYMLMRQCWNFEPHVRPNFTEIVENLDKILTATANINEEYLDLAIPTIETPPSSSDEDESDTETLRETSLMRYNY